MKFMEKVNEIYYSKFEAKEVAVYGVTSRNGLTTCEILSKAFITIGTSAHVYIDSKLNDICELNSKVPVFAELCNLVGRGEWNTEGVEVVLDGAKVNYRGIFSFKSDNGLDNVMKDKGLSVIKDDNGTPIVLYKENLIIPLITMYYNVKRLPNSEQKAYIDNANELLKHILVTLGYELNPSSELDMISYSISDRVRTKRVSSLQREIESHNSNVKVYRERLSLELVNLNNKIAMLSGIEENSKPIKFTPNDKIKSIELVGDKLICKTNFLYFRASNGGRYALGEMRIEFNIENHVVKFFNETDTRRSVWGRNCQHPHVGTDGDGCLGNASEAIAMFSSNYEYSALLDICIAYLESSNLDDSAGKYTMNWDRVDEEGNVIWKGAVDSDRDKFYYNKRNCMEDYIEGRRLVTCQCCQKQVPENEIKHVSGEEVCGACIEENYRWCQICDHYELKEKVFTTVHGENVCKDCIAELKLIELHNGRYARQTDAYFCSECGKYFSASEYVVDAVACIECASKKVVEPVQTVLEPPVFTDHTEGWDSLFDADESEDEE